MKVDFFLEHPERRADPISRTNNKEAYGRLLIKPGDFNGMNLGIAKILHFSQKQSIT